MQLSEADFRTVGKVVGTDSVAYDLVFGGMKKKRLYAADPGKGSRAVVNVITEEHLGGVIPFYYKRTLTVSGQVIEFTR